MKRIGLIVALALIVAIGGAYATWTYTQATNNVGSAEGTAALSITGYELKTVDGGTISVDTSGVEIKVDDIGDGTHKAKLEISGDIIVKFTPNANDTETKGLSLKCTPSIEGTNSFGTPAQTIFALKTTELASTGEVGDAATYVEGGNYAYWTIDPNDIIQLNEGGVFATSVDAYQALKTAVEATTLKLTVSPATTVNSGS